MAQITEDYVSFETAKLLKEKGFNETCRAFWKDWNGELHLCSCCSNHVFEWCHNSMLENYNDNEETNIAAPTLQMAMKWLREKHNLIISVKFTIHGWLCDITKIFRDSNGFIVNINHGVNDDVLPYCDEYEKSCDMAIKYCLENLI